MELVICNNGKATTTSMKVAEYFGKRHDDVLKAIRKLLEDQDVSTRRNFAVSDYQDSTGRKLPMYELDRDGFTLLAMGFTGKQALTFKLSYIDAFNKAEQALSGDVFTMNALNDPATMRNLLLSYAEKNIEMQPKALAFDMLMSTKNSMTMGEAAKALGWGRNMLFGILRNDKILMHDNVPYQEFIDRDYFRVRTVTVEIGDHTEMKTQTLVTAKGLNWLAQQNVTHMQARKALLARKAENSITGGAA